MELRAAYIGGMPGQDWSEWRSTLYFDDESRLRKCVRQYRYPEGDGDYIYYFDTAGVAIYSMSRCNSGHDGDISVCLYRDEESCPRYLDYLEQWGDGSDALVEHIMRNGVHKAIEISDSLSYPPNAQALIRYTARPYDWQESGDSIKPLIQWLVNFEEPRSGEWSFVNGNKIPVYKMATEQSLIVGYLKVSDNIQIRKVIRDWYEVIRPANNYEEREDYYSGYPEIAGYIRKEFVEPLEKITGSILGDEQKEKHE